MARGILRVLIAAIISIAGRHASRSRLQAQVALDGSQLHSAAVQSPNDIFDANYTPFQPLGSLDLLSEEHFTTLTHPAFKRHSVRVKKSKFCDGSVNSYTGYIDIDAHHLFFYFFESRRDPANDDVVLWTNGGPGASSAVGLFMELGPCRVLDADGPKYNPYSWNDRANIFFIDQPVNVGWSYSTHGQTVKNTEEAAKDIAAFMAIFFQHFTKFQGRPLHLAGESYGGRYVPVFGAEIYDQNKVLEDAGFQPINLSSIMIGNGVVNWFLQIPTNYDMLCSAGSLPPVLPIRQCVYYKQMVPRCRKWLKESCIDQLDRIGCSAALDFCERNTGEPYADAGLNPYDISKKCEGKVEETLCYPETRFIPAYLNDPKTRKILGTTSFPNGNFSTLNMTLSKAFNADGDVLRKSDLEVAALLERGVRVLVYVGTYDYGCNYIGSELWTVELEWSGKGEFGKEPLREWVVSGKRAGLTRSANGLTYATIDGAGHMAPYDKPEESLQLVNRWFAGEEL